MSRFSQDRGEEGGAAVEFIVVAPVMLAFCMACLQFAVIFFSYLGMLSTARDVTRWITVNPNTVDSTAIATVKTHLPSDIDPTKLTVNVTPACTTLTNNKCANRAAGQNITVAVSYDISSLYFLPKSFSLAGTPVIQLPSSLPPYTMNMQAEPT